MKETKTKSPESQESVKGFYAEYHDPIIQERYNSAWWLRRYTHRQIHAQFLPWLEPGSRVLDAGCGEGVLSCMAAREKDVDIIGTDISGPNVKGAIELAASWGVRAKFLQADSEALPFPDESFDVVISSHVLEHLPHRERGLAEIYRLTRSRALIAMPTCFGPASWTLLGGDNFWRLRFRRTMPLAIPIGIGKIILAFLRGEDGPNEGYAGHDNFPHIWRFPWVMRRQIEAAGFEIEQFEAGPLILPYLFQYVSPLRRLQPAIDRQRARPFIRNFGHGSLAVCRKRKD